jgi:hypothetical protein
MPLVRYFVVMGGVLLSLLFLADSYLPKPDTAASSADIDRSTIRLRSSQKWPEAIQMDTSAVVPALPVVASGHASDDVPASTRAAYASVAPPAPKSEKLEVLEKPVRHSGRAGRVAARNQGRRIANYQPPDLLGWAQAGW